MNADKKNALFIFVIVAVLYKIRGFCFQTPATMPIWSVLK